MQFWVMTTLVHSFLMYLFMPLDVSSSTSDSHSPECVIPDDVLIQFGPPDDEHSLLETFRGINKYMKKECIKLVITQKFYLFFMKCIIQGNNGRIIVNGLLCFVRTLLLFWNVVSEVYR
jgi:hypothetical protein